MIPSINTKKITASARGLFATIKEGFRTNTKDLSEVLLDKIHNPTPRRGKLRELEKVARQAPNM